MKSLKERNQEQPLTPRQRRFTEEYCVDFNGLRAAIRAEYSPNGAGVSASRLLKNANVLKVIEERMEVMSMSAAEAQMRLTSIGRGSVESFMDWGQPVVGGVPALSLTTDEALQHLHLIKKIEQVETVVRCDEEETVVRRTTKIELHDAKDAMIQLARIRRLFVEREEVSRPDGGAIPVDVRAVHAAFISRIDDIAARQRASGAHQVDVSPAGNGV